jgi:hypothetical protein
MRESLTRVADSKSDNLPSNDDIQITFNNFKNQIISSIDYFPREKLFYTHIYSYPYIQL